MKEFELECLACRNKIIVEADSEYSAKKIAGAKIGWTLVPGFLSWNLYCEDCAFTVIGIGRKNRK